MCNYAGLERFLTVDAAVSSAAHGVPRATLADLPAGQADPPGVAAELVPAAVIVDRANTCQLRCWKEESAIKKKKKKKERKEKKSPSRKCANRSPLLQLARCATASSCVRGELTCKVSADLCPAPPEGEVRGLGLTASAPLLPKTPGKFLMELEFTGTVPAQTSQRYPKSARYASSARCIDGICMLLLLLLLFSSYDALTARRGEKKKHNAKTKQSKSPRWE